MFELNALLKDLQSKWIFDQSLLLPKLEKIKEQVDGRDADYHRFRGEYTAMQSQLRAKEAQIEERDAQLRTLRRQLDAQADVESDITAAALEVKLKRANDRIAQLQAANEVMTAQLNNAKLDARASLYDTHVDTIQHLQADKQKLAERIDDLKKANDSLLNDLSKTVDGKAQLVKQVDYLVTSNNQLSRKLAECTRENAILAKSLADANASTAAWRKKHASAQREPTSDACKQLVAGLRQMLADLEHIV